MDVCPCEKLVVGHWNSGLPDREVTAESTRAAVHDRTRGERRMRIRAAQRKHGLKQRPGGVGKQDSHLIAPASGRKGGHRETWTDMDPASASRRKTNEVQY